MGLFAFIRNKLKKYAAPEWKMTKEEERHTFLSAHLFRGSCEALPVPYLVFLEEVRICIVTANEYNYADAWKFHEETLKLDPLYPQSVKTEIHMIGALAHRSHLVVFEVLEDWWWTETRRLGLHQL